MNWLFETFFSAESYFFVTPISFFLSDIDITDVAMGLYARTEQWIVHLLTYETVQKMAV